MGERPQDQTARVRFGFNVLSRADRADRADTADETTQRQYARWLRSGGVFVATVGHTLFVATRRH